VSANAERLDVVVVGAGVAGAALATALARTGLRIALVDRSPRCRPCFKAEKVEPDQADLLRELGLFAGVRPVLTPIRSIDVAWRGRVLDTLPIEQYGVDYWELANALRAQVPPGVVVRVGAVRGVEFGPAWQRAILADGSALEARLVVLACGTSPSLAKAVGIEHRPIRAGHSLAFGFDIEVERSRGAADSLTYHSERTSSRLDFLTLFPIGKRVRANLFTYLSPSDPAARAWLQHPDEALCQSFPRLRGLVRRISVTSRVEAQVIDLYTVPGPVRDGVLLVGDAHQSVCPATGTGLSKVLTDVRCASERIPAWLGGSGPSAAALAGYYEDARKRACDTQSLEWAEHRRNFSTRTSLRWRIHRARTWLGLALGRG